MAYALEQAHAAAYGAPLGGGRLSVPSQMEAAFAATYASTDVPRAYTPAAAFPSSAHAVAASRASSPQFHAPSTTPGVFTPQSDVDGTPAGVPRRGSKLPWIAAVVLLTGVGLGVSALYVSRNGGPSPAAKPSPPEPTTEVAASADAGAPLALAPLVSAEPAPADAGAKAVAVPRPPLPGVAPPQVAPPPPPPPPPPPSAAPPPPPKPNCNPPYTLDPSGKKLWKMECIP
jgi:hypothetical protein